MSDDSQILRADAAAEGSGGRRVRADAKRNLDALLQAAKAVFATAGVDAPVRDIAERAGVGVGTLYRHFPQRADLIAAVFRREIDACADTAAELAAENPPFAALAKWIERYVGFVGTKRGLAVALHAGDPAYQALPAHRNARLLPALEGLLRSAAESGEIRRDIEAEELLAAVANLCCPPHGTQNLAQTQRMVSLLVDGLRFRPTA